MKRILPIVVLLLAVIAGFTELIRYRFERGDVYPTYSTFRADPVGGKALYEALAATPGLTLERNLRPLEKTKFTQPTTLIYSAAPISVAWRKKELAHLEAALLDGSRVIIAFSHLNSADWLYRKSNKDRAMDKNFSDSDPDDEEEKEPEPKKKKPAKETKPDDAKKPDPATDKKDPASEDDEANHFPLVLFGEFKTRWGYDTHRLSGLKADDRFATIIGNAQGSIASDRAHGVKLRETGLPEKLSWHSNLTFDHISPDWRIIYERRGKPVLIERQWGRGSIVLMADSFLLSNEAMRDDRQPALLAWLVGPSRHIIFDEESKGVASDPGIATLARRYRLGPAVGVLILVALLYIWKNAAPLLPTFDSRDPRAGEVTGLDSATGFLNVLHRAIPASEIIAACVAEWQRTFSRTTRPQDAALIAELAASEAARKQPATVYARMAGHLSRKK